MPGTRVWCLQKIQEKANNPEPPLHGLHTLHSLLPMSTLSLQLHKLLLRTAQGRRSCNHRVPAWGLKDHLVPSPAMGREIPL